MHESVSRKMSVSDILFRKTTEKIALNMMQRTVDRIRGDFNTTEKIAISTWKRYQDFLNPDCELMPAIMAYNGQVFKHLDAASLSEQAIDYANEHFWIVDALYGLLRPLNGIRLYRMEGHIELGETEGDCVFDIWKKVLTDYLLKVVKADDGVLVNLFPEEFKRNFDWKKIEQELKVVQPVFKELRNGRPRTIVVRAKSCRGAMARFILENELKNPDELTGFDYDGYVYAPEYNQGNELWFLKR